MIGHVVRRKRDDPRAVKIDAHHIENSGLDQFKYDFNRIKLKTAQVE